MAELKKQYDEKLAQKEDLRKKAEHTEMMLDRASKLVSGLAGERSRWEETVAVRRTTQSLVTIFIVHAETAIELTAFGYVTGHWHFITCFILANAYLDGQSISQQGTTHK